MPWTRLDDHPTTLYRFFATDGFLLYIGVTQRTPERWARHAYDKPWWREVATITLAQFATRGEAEQAERRAIAIEQPLHNHAHNYAGKHDLLERLRRAVLAFNELPGGRKHVRRLFWNRYGNLIPDEDAAYWIENTALRFPVDWWETQAEHWELELAETARSG